MSDLPKTEPRQMTCVSVSLESFTAMANEIERLRKQCASLQALVNAVQLEVRERAAPASEAELDAATKAYLSAPNGVPVREAIRRAINVGRRST